MKKYTQIFKRLSNITPKTVLEIGSRDGKDAKILATNFAISHNKVFLVDPSSVAAKTIKDNYPEANFYNVGIHLHDGVSVFLENETPESIDGDGMSSFLKREPEKGEILTEHQKEVETWTGKTLLKNIGEESIDLCKIDVEGLTFHVLRSFKEDIIKIKSFHLECEHKEYWKGQVLYRHIYELLISKGYVEVYKEMAPTYYIAQSDNIFMHKSILKEDFA